MKLALCILSVLYVLQVKGDSVTELKKLANDVAQKTLYCDQDFFNSVIMMLSNMKDLATFSLYDTWNSTYILFNNVNKSAETTEQKDCIASERKKLSEIIEGVAYSLFNCGRYALEFANPLRKKVQVSHRASLQILNDLQSVKEICSSKIDQIEDECISLQLKKLETSMQDLLQQLVTFKIEGSTIKPRILSDTLDCNARVLREINKEIINLHERVKECIQ